MEENKNVVVVIDPSQETHPALERALLMAKTSKNNSDIKYTSYASYCSEQWVKENISERMEGLSIPFTTLIGWGSDWRELVISVSTEMNAVMTIVPFYGKVGDHFLSDEKWKLLRNSPNPILLASKSALKESRRMLCSIKSQDESYSEKNDNVLNIAKIMASTFDIELHIVNAYSDSMSYPNRAKLASEIGIANDQIHVKMGAPEDVICDTANELDSPLVVIASQRRTGFQGALKGNTVEKILERVARDVLLV